MSEPAIYTRPARAAAVKAAEWVADDDPVAASRLRRAFEEAGRLIGARPEIGRRQPALIGDRLRIWSLPGFPYLLIYNPMLRPPRVLRVIHTSRDLPAALADLRG